MIKVNPVQDTLQEMNNTAQLLEVVQLYNTSPQHQYRDQYSAGATDKDNQELQYLLGLRDFMIQSHSLPNKNDQAYKSEIMSLVRKYGYSIKENNAYNDTLAAIEDRIVNLLTSRARRSSRASAKKAVPAKSTYYDEYSGINPVLDAQLKDVDDQIDRARVNFENGIISQDKFQLKIDNLSIQRKKILQARKPVITKQSAVPVQSVASVKVVSAQVVEIGQVLAPAQKINQAHIHSALYTISGIGKNQKIVVKQPVVKNVVQKVKDVDDLHFVDTDASDDGRMEELD